MLSSRHATASSHKADTEPQKDILGGCQPACFHATCFFSGEALILPYLSFIIHPLE